MLYIFNVLFSSLQEEVEFPVHTAFAAARSSWLRKQLLTARDSIQVCIVDNGTTQINNNHNNYIKFTYKMKHHICSFLVT